MIDGHGDDAYRFLPGKIRYNFSSNIFSRADHSGLLDYLHELGDYFSIYPEPEPLSLSRKIASILHVDPECVMVTNGVTEAIYLIAMLRKGTFSYIPSPTFREYEDACKMHGHYVCFTDDPIRCDGFDNVWICNPNNPTGEFIPKDVVIKVATENPKRLFIIDGAYSSYCIKESISAREAVECGNILLLKSLTKDFSIPGLRIGYVVGDDGLISSLRGLRMPWSVNSTAIYAADYLLGHRGEYLIDADGLHDEALRIAAEFHKLGIVCSRSDCNFMLCRLPSASAPDLKDYLAQRHGILIRDASNFQGLDGHYFRVAAQSEAENDLLIKCVKEWMNL